MSNCPFVCLERQFGDCLLDNPFTVNLGCENCDFYKECISCMNYSCDDCPNG